MKTFEELGVSGEIRKAIEELGFVQPMPVQEAVIPYLLENKNDVIALSQTGTGKTAAFGIPLLMRIDTSNRNAQALVLSPTRELCLQITDDIRDFAKYMDGVHVEAVYGGASIEPQMRSLKKGVQIIVATPGRLVDLKNRGVADLSGIQNIVLDEADEMLNMGFSDSINRIFEAIPYDRRQWQKCGDNSRRYVSRPGICPSHSPYNRYGSHSQRPHYGYQPLSPDSRAGISLPPSLPHDSSWQRTSECYGSH